LFSTEFNSSSAAISKRWLTWIAAAACDDLEAMIGKLIEEIVGTPIDVVISTFPSSITCAHVHSARSFDLVPCVVLG
jgi:hypothetical protein